MINKTLAEIIKNQCIGSYNGHMAAIAYNPTIESIFAVLMSDIYTPQSTENQRFSKVLRGLADALDPQEASDER